MPHRQAGQHIRLRLEPGWAYHQARSNQRVEIDPKPKHKAILKLRVCGRRGSAMSSIERSAVVFIRNFPNNSGEAPGFLRTWIVFLAVPPARTSRLTESVCRAIVEDPRWSSSRDSVTTSSTCTNRLNLHTRLLLGSTFCLTFDSMRQFWSKKSVYPGT